METANLQETKWYVLRVVSGKERKVKEYLDKEISRGGWGEIVKQVFLPVEKVYKVQNGKKVMRERNYYPGYVMIEVKDGKLSDDLREAIKNTNSDVPINVMPPTDRLGSSNGRRTINGSTNSRTMNRPLMTNSQM